MAVRRYHTLDALRGVAAIVVLAGHSNLLLLPLPRPRASLAVDLFFVLSGFILAKIYEPRFAAGMSAQEFLLQRYARLLPMFFVGSAIGLSAALVAYVLHHGTMTLPMILAAGVTGLFMLPSFATMGSIPDLYPLNHPGWSIFYEVLVNLIYYLLWRRFPARAVVVVMLLSGVALLALHVAAFGFSGPSWAYAWAGIPRVCFSFFAGVLLGRRRTETFKTSAAAWLAPVATFVMLYAMPADLPAGGGIGARIFEPAMVFIGFPLLVWLAASVEPRRAAPFVWLGAISYPLYAIHEPIIYLAWSASQAVGMPAASFAPWSGLLFAALVIAPCAWLARHYEKPAERRLKHALAARPGTGRSWPV